MWQWYESGYELPNDTPLFTFTTSIWEKIPCYKMARLHYHDRHKSVVKSWTLLNCCSNNLTARDNLLAQHTCVPFTLSHSCVHVTSRHGKGFPYHRPFVMGIQCNRWIPLTKGQWFWALVFFMLATTNCWTNSWVLRDLRRSYDVITMCDTPTLSTYKMQLSTFDISPSLFSMYTPYSWPGGAR